MSEIKRRKKTPPAETTASPPRPTRRVTLTKDVSSRYRKLVPRAKAGGSAPGGFAPSRPPQPKEPRPKRGAPPKPAGRPDGRRGGPSVKALIHRELPEAARQLKETQDLLKAAAEEILALLETWDLRLENPTEPGEETRDLQALITSLFEKMSFQDLAGQRLAKVEIFLKALGEIVQPAEAADRFRPPRSKPQAAEGSKPPRRDQNSAAKKTLKGPQATGGGLDQQEIEALLADLNK